MKIKTGKNILRNQTIIILAAFALLADVAPSGCGSSDGSSGPPIPVEPTPTDEAEKPQE